MKILVSLSQSYKQALGLQFFLQELGYRAQVRDGNDIFHVSLTKDGKPLQEKHYPTVGRMHQQLLTIVRDKKLREKNKDLLSRPTWDIRMPFGRIWLDNTPYVTQSHILDIHARYEGYFRNLVPIINTNYNGTVNLKFKNLALTSKKHSELYRSTAKKHGDSIEPIVQFYRNMFRQYLHHVNHVSLKLGPISDTEYEAIGLAAKNPRITYRK